LATGNPGNIRNPHCRISTTQAFNGDNVVLGYGITHRDLYWFAGKFPGAVMNISSLSLKREQPMGRSVSSAKMMVAITKTGQKAGEN